MKESKKGGGDEDQGRSKALPRHSLNSITGWGLRQYQNGGWLFSF